MIKISKCLTICFLVAGIFSSNLIRGTQVLAAPQILQEQDAQNITDVLSVSFSPTKVKEGNDFATRVLTDPWDMNEFSDISRYLNESNVAQHLTNISVNNSIFSAITADTDPQFFTLFPGYQSSIDSLNIPVRSGALFPIDSAKYHCLYTRMKIGTSSPDNMRIFWFADKYLGNGKFGVTNSITIPSTGWEFYSIDLKANFDGANSNTAWANSAQWRGLRFDPTTKKNINFAVDWVRLTDCNPVTTKLTWTATSGTVQVWAGINAKNLDFKVASVDGSLGSYNLDIQGWQAGQYYIGIKDSAGNMSWSSQPLVIDAAPLITIEKPSYDTGASITWNMNSASDLDTTIAGTRCVNYYFQNGMLYTTTLPPSQLPGDCQTQVITGEYASDPELVLNMPISKIDTTVYRYLTIRTHMDGMIQDINHGWSIRWLWKTYENGDPNKWCINVSNDIVFDPDWQTIVVDLFDSASGTTEDWVGNTNCYSRHWTNSPVYWLRLDPNENTTGSSFNQIFDSITLSQEDGITHGQAFPVQIQSNEPVSTLNFNLYYTSDPKVYNQNHAAVYSSSAPPAGSYKSYLPLAFYKTTSASSSNAKTIYWNTSTVAPGLYYVCTDASDGLNTVNICSAAPVSVK